MHLLAVTDNASLVIGLTFAPRDWQVTSQSMSDGWSEEDAAGLSPDVLVLDVGPSADAMAVFERLPGVARAVIVADDEPTGPVPQEVTVLLRPYTIESLVAAIDGVLGTAQDTDTTAGSGPASEPGAVSDPSTVPEPDEGATASPGTGTDQDLSTSPRAEGFHVAYHDMDAQDDDRSLRQRLFGRLSPLGRAGRTGQDEATTAPAPAEPEAAGADGHAAPEPEDADEPAAQAGADDGPGVQALDSREVEEEPDAAADDGVVVRRRAPEPTPAAAGAPAATPAPAAAAAPTGSRTARWRARRQRTVSPQEQALRERLTQVLTATGELEHLLADLPLLADLDALSGVIVAELAQELAADTAALWRGAGDGWYPAAHIGFTTHEATWRVPADQPLFAELHQTGGAMLIDPIDAVPAAVAGIAGAHTNGFMAAAIAVGPGRFGLLAVGRNQPLGEQELETLEHLATEVAPGLAVAEQLLRIREVLGHA